MDNDTTFLCQSESPAKGPSLEGGGKSDRTTVCRGLVTESRTQGVVQAQFES